MSCAGTARAAGADLNPGMCHCAAAASSRGGRLRDAGQVRAYTGREAGQKLRAGGRALRQQQQQQRGAGAHAQQPAALPGVLKQARRMAVHAVNGLSHIPLAGAQVSSSTDGRAAGAHAQHPAALPGVLNRPSAGR